MRVSAVQRILMVFAALLGSLLVAGSAAATTTSEAAVFTYDVHTTERVAVHEFEDVDASTAHLGGQQDRSVSSDVEVWGTSTTPPLSVVATNKVSAYDVGTYDDLVAASAKGDGLDIHHVMQDHAAQQLIPGATRGNGTAIALPQAEHRLIPNLKGDVSLTPRQVLGRLTPVEFELAFTAEAA